MSDFDLFGADDLESFGTLEEEKPPHEPVRASDLIYNALTLFFLAATIAVCLLTVLLVQNPTVPFNPFPPPTPRPTSTLFVLGEATQSSGEAPSPTAPPTATATVLPIVTPTIPPTPMGVTPLPLVTHTPAAFPFTLQDGTYAYTQYSGEEGCDYMAIAGQVFDLNGEPLKFIPIQVRDADGFFETIVFSGSAPQYGPSGYEVLLNTSPYEAEFTVQLISETARPLSDEIVVRTRDSCAENLIIVNFVQSQPLP